MFKSIPNCLILEFPFQILFNAGFMCTRLVYVFSLFLSILDGFCPKTSCNNFGECRDAKCNCDTQHYGQECGESLTNVIRICMNQTYYRICCSCSRVMFSIFSLLSSTTSSVVTLTWHVAVVI